MRANIIRGSSQTEPNHKGTTIETKKYTEKKGWKICVHSCG